MMTAIQYFWRHELAEQVREEGREKGRAEERSEMVLNILRWRGIEVSNLIRERVESCSDLDRLEAWAQRAVHATSAEALFADD
jgi:hypothetical protein